MIPYIDLRTRYNESSARKDEISESKRQKKISAKALITHEEFIRE